MYFIIQRELILKPLQIMGGLVERRQTKPILGHFLLKVVKDQLFITATDSEIEMTMVLNVPGAKEGITTVPGRKFIDISRSLSTSDEIKVQLEKTHVIITAGKSKFQLVFLPEKEFPQTLDEPFKHQFKINSKDLRKIISRTQFAMGQQDVRHYLNGLMLEFNGKKLRAVSTDGHRLALSEIACEDTPGLQVVIPRKGVIELGKLLEETDEEIDFGIGDKHIKVNFSHMSFYSKLIESKFPEYHRVIPNIQSKNIMHIEKQNFKESLQRVSILSSEKLQGVQLDIRKNEMLITVNNTEQEKAEEYLTMHYGGSPMVIAFNIHYLLDVLNVLPDGLVEMILGDSASSCVMREPEKSDSLFVIMPMMV